MELLALASLIRRRRPLPDNDAEFLSGYSGRLIGKRSEWFGAMRKRQLGRSSSRSRRISGRNPGCIVALAPPWQELAEDLLARHDQLREYLTNELEVPQGRTRGGTSSTPSLYSVTFLQFERGSLSLRWMNATRAASGKPASQCSQPPRNMRR